MFRYILCSWLHIQIWALQNCTFPVWDLQQLEIVSHNFTFSYFFLQKISLIWGFLAISVQHEERLLHIVHFWGSYCPLSLRLPQKFCCQEIFMVASIGFIGTQILSRLQRVCKNELVLVCSSNGRSDGHWKKDSFVLSLKEKGIFQDLLSSEEESFPLRPFYGAIKAKWTLNSDGRKRTQGPPNSILKTAGAEPYCLINEM